jgi:phosphoribosyl-ATP pyrophosphohydrolase
MSWMQDLVEQFHRKHRHPVYRQHVQLVDSPQELKLLRGRLIVEEATEALVALQENDDVGFADALADLLYVTFGAALSFGIPLDEVFKEVHASNMSKAALNRHGKGGKGHAFFTPNVAGILAGTHRVPTADGVPDPAGFLADDDAAPVCRDADCSSQLHTTADPRCLHHVIR